MRPLSSIKTVSRGILKKPTDVIKRKSSGIKGLDELIEGGIPNHFAVLLIGPRRCGKSIFGYQILWEGLRNGEGGIVMAYDHSPNEIRRSMTSFGWNVTLYEKKNKFAIIDCFNGIAGIDSHEKYYVQNPLDFDQLIYILETCVSEVVSKSDHFRVFHDVGTVAGNVMGLPHSFRLARRFHSYVKKYNAVALTSLHKGAQNKLVENLIGQIIDGVIEFDMRTENDRMNNYLWISKMSMTNRNGAVHPYVINDNGITILKPRTSE